MTDQQKQAEAIAAKVAENKQAFRAAFGTDSGRKALAYLAISSGQNTPAADLDPQKLAFREGRRSLYLEILAMANATDGPQITPES